MPNPLIAMYSMLSQNRFSDSLHIRTIYNMPSYQLYIKYKLKLIYIYIPSIGFSLWICIGNAVFEFRSLFPQGNRLPNVFYTGAAPQCWFDCARSASAEGIIYMQDCSISNALAMVLPQSCTKPLTYPNASILKTRTWILGKMIEICSQGPSWLQINIDLDTGLALYWWQARVWTNVDNAYSI